MLTPLFELLRCSWPRPGEQPEWDAPLMPTLPQPDWQEIQDEVAYVIDWNRFFAGSLRYWGSYPHRGEMRGFHVVFQLRLCASGTLHVKASHACTIRRDGAVLATGASCTLEVRPGDCLEVVDWQRSGRWQWSAALQVGQDDTWIDEARRRVERRLQQPNGPTLKMYFDGRTPLRTALSLYSMVLNGYQPAQVLVFGEYQWSEQSRRRFAELFPFARIVPTDEVLEHVRLLAGTRLVELALRHWFVMKGCIGPLYPPADYCFMDDDIFVLQPVQDALTAFQRHQLVYIPDQDHSAEYEAFWGRPAHGTGEINTGLYWLRRRREARALAETMVQVVPRIAEMGIPIRYIWDQGLIATHCVQGKAYQLPSTRYFYPYLDGLPGGIMGYDYALNPCGFTCVHYGAVDKPSDRVASLLARDVLHLDRPD